MKARDTLRGLLSALCLCAVVTCLAGCGVHASAAIPETVRPQFDHRALTLPKYVIVMVQENRTVDNLFQTQPGVDTQNFGIDSHGHYVPLTQTVLNVQYDCDHSHQAFVKDVERGFDTEHCGKTTPPDAAFTYVDPSEITEYTALASRYAFADEVLQSNEGPSFAAHLYLIAATSGTPGSDLNLADESKGEGGSQSPPNGCNAPRRSTDLTIDMTSAFPGQSGPPKFPCIDPVTIFNELDNARISWKYYTPSTSSIWTAPYMIQSLYQNDKANVIVPETNVLSDIQNGRLARVSFVIPRSNNSDHPKTGSGGPAWVASVVNALGTSQYWNQCAIIIVWDDWGGWYDHVSFRHPLSNPVDPYEYGFRVPLIAVGPFAKANWVDHTPRDFAAIPHFIEDVYGLPSLGQLDSQTDDLFSMFDFGAKARKYTWVPTGPVTIKSLINLPPDPTPIDSE